MVLNTETVNDNAMTTWRLHLLMTQSFIHHTKHVSYNSCWRGGERKINVNVFEKIISYGLQTCQSENDFSNKAQELPVHNKAQISLLNMHVTGHTKWTLILSCCMVCKCLTTGHLHSKEHKSGKNTHTIILYF